MARMSPSFDDIHAPNESYRLASLEEGEQVYLVSVAQLQQQQQQTLDRMRQRNGGVIPGAGGGGGGSRGGGGR